MVGDKDIEGRGMVQNDSVDGVVEILVMGGDGGKGTVENGGDNGVDDGGSFGNGKV